MLAQIFSRRYFKVTDEFMLIGFLSRTNAVVFAVKCVCFMRRTKQMKTYVLQPFLIGAAGAYGMSVGYAMFDITALMFKRKR